MASKLNPNVLYVAEHGEPLGSPQADSERTHIAGEAGEESSDSDGEQEETSHKLIRKVSTSGQIRAKIVSFLHNFINRPHPTLACVYCKDR
ncbi:Diacylglycerol kinase eta [Collichthys lucidus]|uniref:Diacylglycerol kinase eta n=1 Tax=Collichthys lucidus TaxID=240159 RepID=A0A4U5VW92_COLLU|nr:Diacylglycerol kinase eta [Collichthys lucidus]TKS93106.1 Diacylglycerol kinase eta [Collichthys lucidus]